MPRLTRGCLPHDQASNCCCCALLPAPDMCSCIRLGCCCCCCCRYGSAQCCCKLAPRCWFLPAKRVAEPIPQTCGATRRCWCHRLPARTGCPTYLPLHYPLLLLLLLSRQGRLAIPWEAGVRVSPLLLLLLVRVLTSCLVVCIATLVPAPP